MGPKKSNKILITGGAGNLGTEIRKLVDCIAPDASELDVIDFALCQRAIKKYNPDIIIHCAAFTDVAGAEEQKEKCWSVNVAGTENVARCAVGRRLVYISTDYVFDGEKGNYVEEDIPNPQNFYSLTKLVGEVIVRQYDNTLIIRTAFKPDGWAPEKVFEDQFVSHEFVSTIAPEILKAVLMNNLAGVMHIAGKRKSMSSLAPNAKKILRNSVSTKIPHDTSLNISKWQKILSQSNHAKK